MRRWTFLKTRKKMDSSMEIISHGFSCAVELARELALRVLHVENNPSSREIPKLIATIIGKQIELEK